MTLQLRQPLPTARFEKLIDEALHAENGPALYRDVFKRALDVALVILGALPILLIVGVFALLIARDGHSPFYAQKRLGRNGRVFNIWKLRSMVPDAEARLSAYLDKTPAARAEWDRTQKLRNDPRITAIGRLIRKTSIDELPQLFNVLTGQLSLVGPRPHASQAKAAEELYERVVDGYFARHKVKPGITGWAQVMYPYGASVEDARKKLQFDLFYIKNYSLLLDLVIAVKTTRVMLTGRGT